MTTTSITKCSVNDLRAVIASNSKINLVDVRESVEYEADHIAGSLNIPLSTLGKEIDGFSGVLEKRPTYLLCRTGKRAQKSARMFSKAGFKDVAVVDGGVEGWKGAGFALEHNETSVWSLDRQIRFTAGSLVLGGVVLALAKNRAWLLLSGFVGAGLIFSAITDTCGMGLLLARMPWNRKTSSEKQSCEQS